MESETCYRRCRCFSIASCTSGHRWSRRISRRGRRSRPISATTCFTRNDRQPTPTTSASSPSGGRGRGSCRGRARRRSPPPGRLPASAPPATRAHVASLHPRRPVPVMTRGRPPRRPAPRVEPCGRTHVVLVVVVLVVALPPPQPTAVVMRAAPRTRATRIFFIGCSTKRGVGSVRGENGPGRSSRPRQSRRGTVVPRTRLTWSWWTGSWWSRCRRRSRRRW